MINKKCKCLPDKKCKSCYDFDRRKKIKSDTWIFNNKCPQNLTDEQTQILIGGLLGDLSLYQYKNQINAGIHITRASKDVDYLIYQFEFFKDFCQTGIQKKDQFDKRTNKIYTGFYFRTQLSGVFTKYRNLWYPNGIKIVPKGLKLTPLICAIWFCDDGSVTRYSKYKKRLRLSLATDGFSLADVKFLAVLLNDLLNINIKVTRKNSCKDPNKGYYLYCSHEDTVKFIKYIEPVFPKSMIRKSLKWEGLL